MEKEEIKWCTLENFDATYVCAEHGFIRKERKRPYSDETYIANVQLCNKRRFCSEDGEGPVGFDAIDFYSPEPGKNACMPEIISYPQ